MQIQSFILSTCNKFVRVYLSFFLLQKDVPLPVIYDNQTYVSGETKFFDLRPHSQYTAKLITAVQFGNHGVLVTLWGF